MKLSGNLTPLTEGLLEGFNVKDLSFHPIVEVVKRVLESLSLNYFSYKMVLTMSLSDLYRSLWLSASTNFDEL